MGVLSVFAFPENISTGAFTAVFIALLSGAAFCSAAHNSLLARSKVSVSVIRGCVKYLCVKKTVWPILADLFSRTHTS